MVLVEVRERGKRTRIESLQSRQASQAGRGHQCEGHADLIAKTFGEPRVAKQAEERVIHDTRKPHH